MTTMIERLADLEHQQWVHWTAYMLDNLSPGNIERWRRQIQTPYSDLSDEEKESDRAWARKALVVLLCPTKGMVAAGEAGYDREEICTVRADYHAMIGAALKEEVVT